MNKQNGISEILAQTPVLSTFGSEALAVQPQDVLKIYKWHASTFAEPAKIGHVRNAFVDAVKAGKTPKACLVAPFGYGKTATAIGIWKSCEQANILAVPPVSCDSFAALARCVRDWTIYTLPESKTTLVAAYERFLTDSAEALARRDESQFGIPYVQAIAAIRDKLERGYLDFDDVSVNLVSFFEECTNVTVKAGFDGLVIMVDEAQQLIGNANKGVLVALRHLVWGLRTRSLRFGLLITMDPDTERTLADRAGDILHRIKDDGLYINLGHLYDRNFPSHLWEKLSDTLQLRDDSRAVTHDILAALGQWCERDDLSDGPRTVINVFQRALVFWQERAPSAYSPIDLMDDLLQGLIKFDGGRRLLPSILGELLSYPYFQRSADRARALKLIAAYPRGCPEEIAARYGLGQCWQTLRDDLQGETVIQLDEGLALIETQRVAQPANHLNKLLRQYWMQMSDLQLAKEDAQRAFTEVVLPLLFPYHQSGLNGWQSTNDVQLSSEGGYIGTLIGTPSPRFPLRTIRIGIVMEDDHLAMPARMKHDADLHIVIRICLDQEANSEFIQNGEDGFDIRLALARHAQTALPSSIAWMTNYFSPQPLSPMLAISVLRYLKHTDRHALHDKDIERLDNALVHLGNWLLAESFPQSLFASGGIPVVDTGAGAIREVMLLNFAKRFPKYQPLVSSPGWSSKLEEYSNAISQVDLAVRIGEEAFEGTKTELASLFGQKRHAGFESQARLYGNLLHISGWHGETSKAYFSLHPAERGLLEHLQAEKVLEEGCAYQWLRKSGYAPDEVRWLLRLLQQRGLVSISDGALCPAQAPTVASLVKRARLLTERCATLGVKAPSEMAITLQEIQGLTHDLDYQRAVATEQSLDRISNWIDDQERILTLKHNELILKTRAQLMSKLLNLADALPEPISSPLGRHLSALYVQLEKERSKLYTRSREVIEKTVLHQDSTDELLNLVEQWTARAATYRDWIVQVTRLMRMHLALKRIEAQPPKVRQLDSQFDHVWDTLRTSFAERGFPALDEWPRLYADADVLSRQYEKTAHFRERSFKLKFQQMRELVQHELSIGANWESPDYIASDDEESYAKLGRELSARISHQLRVDAIMLAVIGNRRESSRLKRVAQYASDLKWLFTDTIHYHYSPQATREFAKIAPFTKQIDVKLAKKDLLVEGFKRMVSQTIPEKTWFELGDLFTLIPDEALQRDIMTMLLRLHNDGALSIQVGMGYDRK